MKKSSSGWHQASAGSVCRALSESFPDTQLCFEMNVSEFPEIVYCAVVFPTDDTGLRFPGVSHIVFFCLIEPRA
jgi:hypothetical protein